MILCIDSGNSRIKWGLHTEGVWRESGAVGHADLTQLAVLPQRLPMPSCVMLANVAGEDARKAIGQALAPWLPVLQKIESAAAAGGVVNLYENPARLGVDRWCALIGARAMTSALGTRCVRATMDKPRPAMLTKPASANSFSRAARTNTAAAATRLNGGRTSTFELRTTAVRVEGLARQGP